MSERTIREDRNDRKQRLRTHGAITTNDRIHLLSRGPLSPEDDARALDAARALARAWNSGSEADLHAFAKLVADDIVVDSQSFLPALRGKERVLSILEKEVRESHTGGHEERFPLAEVARIDGIHPGEPGMLMTRDDVRTCFVRFEFDDEGQIALLYQVLGHPHPSRAVPTGERPGFDESLYQWARYHLWSRRREAAQRLEGPLEFVVFGIPGAAPPERLADAIERVIAPLYAHVGASVRTVLVQHVSLPGQPPASGAEREAGEAGVVGFPAVAVKRGGEWIRDPRRSYDPLEVVKDLQRLGFWWRVPKDYPAVGDDSFVDGSGFGGGLGFGGGRGFAEDDDCTEADRFATDCGSPSEDFFGDCHYAFEYGGYADGDVDPDGEVEL